MPLNSLELLFSDFLVVLLMSVDLSAWVPRAISSSGHVPLWGTSKQSVELNTYRCRHTECFNDSNISWFEHLACAHRLMKHLINLSSHVNFTTFLRERFIMPDVQVGN